MSDIEDKLIDGKAVANDLLEKVRQRAQRLREHNVVPCLATVLVGDDPASATYVRMKRKRCENVGVQSIKVELPADTTTGQLVEHVRKLSDDAKVHGILLQHPVPGQIDERAGFEAIAPEKDVDGVTVTSLGRMWLGMAGYGSCTPAGIMRLLRAYKIDIEGLHAVVVGRSPILGKPMAAMLINANATVTICHSRTKNLADVVRQADLVVAAVGRPRFVQGDWIKPGAIVVDAGYNEGNVGDVDFEPAAERAGRITPVPGGVGPMTIATLIAQTVQSAEITAGLAGT